MFNLVADKVVTIWHFGDSDNPVPTIFRNVHIDAVKRIEKNGIKQKGFFDGKSATVRIPTGKEIDVMPGDYLYIGECFCENLSYEDALKVIEVKDNRRGGQRHWRIVCGG